LVSKLGRSNDHNRRKKIKRDEFGYTPLHLTAQHNHIAATAMLLKLGYPIDGGDIVDDDDDDDDTEHQSQSQRCPTFTPLHRAAFSGATGTIKILLEWTKPRCNLLAVDTSYGDYSTPLHKATAGGRYLAVHLLIEELKKRSLVKQALVAKDKFNRTPLGVAYHFHKIQDTERNSVARWDGIAGGVADWGKCVQLLENAESECPTGDDDNESITNNNDLNTASENNPSQSSITPTPTTIPELPIHLTLGIEECMDCQTNDGRCLTSSWELAFQKALGNSVSTALHCKSSHGNDGDGGTRMVVHTTAAVGADDEVKEDQVGQQTPLPSSSSSSTTTSTTKLFTGLACAICHQQTFAVYPLPGGQGLVCKVCLRKEC
jgi:hypothetical protein